MILQELLVCGLVDIGEEDKRLEWLEATAAGLAKDYLKNKRKLIGATLVALDDDLPESEPVFVEVEAAVLTHWKALRGKFVEMPRQLLRGVILAALDKVREDATAASIVWLVGGNFLPYARLKKERAIVERLFAEMGELAENAASEAWATAHPFKDLKLPSWSLKAKEFKPVQLNRAWLQERLGAATGTGQAVENYPNNPHQIPQNRQPQWAGHFATHASNAIAEAIDSLLAPVFEQVTSIFTQIDEPLKAHSTAVNSAVREAIRQGVESQIAQERRTALLWWKQTLYSPSRRRGYRGLETAPAAALMAYDLHSAVPSFTPQSVEFLLREAFRDAAGGGALLTGEDFVGKLTSSESTLRLGDLIGTAGASEGRICLLEYARGIFGKSETSARFGTRVGLPTSVALNAAEWSVWLFRDLQALRLAESK